jgi:hypothetical protein
MFNLLRWYRLSHAQEDEDFPLQFSRCSGACPIIVPGACIRLPPTLTDSDFIAAHAASPVID